jgi:tagaturonate reductase
MQPLNRTTTKKSKILPLRIMQFGGGNFLRAFVNWMVQRLNEETHFDGGVVIVKPTDRGDYETLKSQDGLFTVVLNGFKNDKPAEEKYLIDCVQEVVNPYSEWAAFLKLAENKDLRFVVSNTTEAGIKFNPEDNYNDLPPKEFPAKLTIWLYHRFRFFSGESSRGCIILPCELIEHNGTRLKEVIRQYAGHWNLDTDFIHWISASNYFCNTLVDRIVSGYPTELAADLQSELGYRDKLLVAGEYYHSWIIAADKTVEKELPFAQTDLNVSFVNDLTPYRQMKVRILNGAHTALVPVGYLAGKRLVKECMDHPLLYSFIESLLRQEVIKTFDFPEETKQKYVRDVLDRFKNPSLVHKLMDISLNSASKFVTRLLPTLKDFYTLNRQLPPRIVFSLSALIAFYRGEFNGEKIQLKDDPEILSIFSLNWKKYDRKEQTLANMVSSILGNSAIWNEELTKINGLTEMVTDYVDQIQNNGILSILKTIK